MPSMTRVSRQTIPGLWVWSLLVGASLARAEPPQKGAPEPTAAQLRAKATQQVREARLAEAEVTARACIQKYPAEAHCHLLLGSTVARRGRAEEGAKEYREFLRLAPDDPAAPKVKRLLEDYEKSQLGRK